MGGGGGGGSGPTMQQRQLETQQAITGANLNLEENSQRKGILNAMMGTRVFRGSALSRAIAGNTPGGEEAAPAPSRSQLNAGAESPIFGTQASLLDQRQSNATGSTPAGGAGGSASPGIGGGYAGGGRGGSSHA